MKKYLIIIAIILIGALFGIRFLTGPFAANYLSRTLSNSLQVPVTVQKVDFTSDSFIIENLRIANPARSTLQTAAQFRSAEFTTPYTNYLKSDILINDITIDDLYMSIEFYNKKRTRGNWTTLISNLKSDEPKEEKSGRTVFIKLLTINNIVIDLVFPGKSPIRLDPIHRIEFRNLSSEKGIPIKEITEIITQQLMKQISVLKGLQNMIDGIFRAPSQAVEQLFPFRLFHAEPTPDQDDLAEASTNQEE